jgi:hypothetical protein
MKRLLLCLSFCVSLSQCAAVPALADQDWPDNLDDHVFTQRVIEIAEFVRQATGYKTKGLPVVFFRSRDVLNRLHYGKDFDGQDSVQAVAVGNVIFLHSDFKMGVDDYTIAHELTHFMQNASGKLYTCNGEKEVEAYHVQDIYLAAHRVPKDDPRYSDPLTVLAYKMSCQEGS